MGVTFKRLLTPNTFPLSSKFGAVHFDTWIMGSAPNIRKKKRKERKHIWTYNKWLNEPSYNIV